MAIEGVDYAWARPTVASLVAAGKKFACRYGGPGSAGKQLDPAEAVALAAHGLSIVANAEGTADGLAGGWAVGEAWARDAEEHFARCGMPAGRPIYLSVDFDATDSQLKGPVADALLGAGHVLGAGRVGVYGGYKTIVWARANGLASWFWQTYAWSAGRWAPGNHIEQYDNGVSLGGGNIDLNRALKADYGQWVPTGGSGEDMTPEQATQLKDLHYNWFINDSVDRPDTSDAGRLRAVEAAVAALQVGVDEILTALASGLPVAAEVKLSAEGEAQVTAIVDRELDEQSAGGADAD
jgi:hypothetical protein